MSDFDDGQELAKEVLAEAEKMSLELSPIDGEAVRRVVAQMQATPPAVSEQFKAIAGAKN